MERFSEMVNAYCMLTALLYLLSIWVWIRRQRSDNWFTRSEYLDKSTSHLWKDSEIWSFQCIALARSDSMAVSRSLLWSSSLFICYKTESNKSIIFTFFKINCSWICVFPFTLCATSHCIINLHRFTCCTMKHIQIKYGEMASVKPLVWIDSFPLPEGLERRSPFLWAGPHGPWWYPQPGEGPEARPSELTVCWRHRMIRVNATVY